MYRAAEVLVNVGVGSTREVEVGGMMIVLSLGRARPMRTSSRLSRTTPAFIYGGPFANFAQGRDLVMTAWAKLKLADYLVRGRVRSGPRGREVL